MAAEETLHEKATQPGAASSPIEIVAVCASAGGFRAVKTLLSGLPLDFPAAVVIVQHLARNHPSLMAELLVRHCALPVKQASEEDHVLPGHVLIGPPDRHFLVNPDRSISLTSTELVHFLRPSADLLFDSVAGSFGDKAIAVVLSGTGTDGSHGIEAIKKKGGTVLAQDDASSEFGGMPNAAAATGYVDLVLPIEDIAPRLAELVGMSEER